MDPAYSDLSRFADAQAGGIFERALGEIIRGRKRTHWTWFVFPQLRGLGHSEMAARFGISGVEEASAYLAHALLGPRLRESAAAVLRHAGRSSAEDVFGNPDCLKLRSCATLFAEVAESGSVFHELLDVFFGGERDSRTVKMLRPEQDPDSGLSG